jgi:hypothetical protein
VNREQQKIIQFHQLQVETLMKALPDRPARSAVALRQ